jgi:uncharacterized repeat protein (TIGR04138 family)
MEETPIMKTVREICARDTRYRAHGYVFVLEALDFTAKMLNKHAAEGAERHVTGAELLQGIRSYALQQFGPMALTVLKTWGVTSTEDFGNIVFNLVGAGRLRKTAEDHEEDFNDAYDFQDAFAAPFLPRVDDAAPSPPKRRGRKGRKPISRKGESDE